MGESKRTKNVQRIAILGAVLGVVLVAMVWLRLCCLPTPAPQASPEIRPTQTGVVDIPQPMSALAGMPDDLPVYIILDSADAIQAAVRCAKGSLPCPTHNSLDPLALAIGLTEDWAAKHGHSLREEVLPWIGHSIVLGIERLQLSSTGDLGDASVLLAAESLDPEASNSFFKNLEARLSADGWQSYQASYREVDLTVWVTQQDEETSIVYAQAGSMVWIASNVRLLEMGINAQAGASLEGSELYRNNLELLPAQRMATLLINGERSPDFFRQLTSRENIFEWMPGFPGAPFISAAIALSPVETGLRMDVITRYDPADADGVRLEALLGQSEPAQAERMLPAQTLGFYAGRRLDLLWMSLQETMSGTDQVPEFAELIDLIGREFGLNPSEDVFEYLTGNWIYAIVRNDQTERHAGGDQLAGLLVTEVSDDERLLQTAQTLHQRLEEKGLARIEIVQSNDLNIYELYSVTDGKFNLAIGIGRGFLIITSSQKALPGIFTNGGGLIERQDYLDLWRFAPAEMGHRLFIDMRNIRGLAAFRINPEGGEGKSRLERFLDAILTVAAAAGPLEDGVTRTAVILRSE